MRKLGVLVLFLLLLLALPISFANTDYNETGNYDGYFMAGTGFFNDVEMQSSADYSTFSRAIDGIMTPLIADLDNDGVNEIIVIDDNTIRLYNVDVLAEQLTIVDSLNIYDGYYSNMLVYNIDGDEYPEIIIASEETSNEIIFMLQYNGSDFIIEYQVPYTSLTHNTGEVLLKCADVNKCMIAYFYDQVSGGSADQTLRVAGFNTTNVYDQETVLAGGGFQQRCFPTIRNAQVVDYDNDGYNEYVFSFVNFNSALGDSGEQYHIIYVQQNPTASITFEKDKAITDSTVNIDEILGGGSTSYICQNTVSYKTGGGTTYIGSILSNPLVFDIDGSSSNGLETAIAFMLDIDEFRIYVFKADGTELDHYPEINEVDGILISNMIRANIFTDTQNDDFCVMGYENNDQEIDLICASDQTSELYHSREFKMDISGLYNITQSYNQYHSLIHSAQHSTETTDGVNLNEIVNSYGVLEVVWDDIYKIEVPNVYTLNLLFENPKADATVISSDVENVGREDLLALTTTNLWYIDDKYTNSPAYISEYYNNPCLDATWKINTSIETRITVEDIDEDRVGSRAILYYGDSNEQDTGWTTNATSGTTFSFSTFKINKTISVGTLRLMGRDVENPDDVDTIDLTFSVGLNGVEFGDCTTDIELDVPDEAVTVPSECNTDDDCPTNYFCINATCTARDDISVMIGIEEASTLFNMPKSLFWWIVMLGVAIAGITSAKYFNFAHGGLVLVGLIVFIELILLIIGTIIQAISPAYLVIIVTIGIMIVSLWVVRMIFGQSSRGS